MNKTKIELKNLVFFAHHGVLEAEAQLGQRFHIDRVIFEDRDVTRTCFDDTYCCVKYLFNAILLVDQNVCHFQFVFLCKETKAACATSW